MRRFLFAMLVTVVIIPVANAQAPVTLTDMSFFKPSSQSWHIAGDVKADLNLKNVLKFTNGTGVLVNVPAGEAAGSDLFSKEEYGDIDLEMDYMMAKGSNSGIYLQGRYEIQLLDSWGVLHPGSGDNGGIYERWDEKRPVGRQGYEGFAPRQNVSKAPGLWQHLKISFQAPRFSNGVKVANAKLIRVELNNVLIHEDVELSGPTRGGSEGEVMKAPLRLQGDHGTVAFRNIKLTSYDKSKPELSNLSYTVYKGHFEKSPDYEKLSALYKGRSVSLTTNINNLPDSFLLRYTGTLRVTEPGDYSFRLLANGGYGSLTINEQHPSQEKKFTLPAGDLPFELIYFKLFDWAKPSIALAVSGPGIREFMISDANNLNGEPADPILVEAQANTTTLLRSFMDIPGMRIVHAVSVGSPEGLHYTYDMDYSALVQVWKGNFLDATPMWHERGDGSSRPTGSRQLLGKPALNIQRLSAPATEWKTDTAGTGFRPKGYELDEKDRPIFHYSIYGSPVTDAMRVSPNGQGITRTITVGTPSAGLFVRLAAGKTIEEEGNGLYLVDDKAFYIRVDDAGGQAPFIRESKDRKELLIPIAGQLQYTLLF